jgi:organic hydroperoxide reductase OsmC/OhrA
MDASLTWSRKDETFTDNHYSRAHEWRFDGGALVRGSSSPHSVRLPYSDAAAVDPEEALVATDTHVVLRPRVTFCGGRLRDDPAVTALHQAAHERCDIANSLRGEVRVEGSWSHTGAQDRCR